MDVATLYKELQFTNLIKIGEEHPLQEKDFDADELGFLGIDKIHYSGKFPTVLFKEVNSFDEPTLKEIAEIHHKVWNFRKVMFLYVVSVTEIRIYNCTHTPFNYQKEDAEIDTELQRRLLAQATLNDTEKLAELKNLFSAVAIDCGLIWTQADKELTGKLDINRRIDKFLVSSLLKTGDVLLAKGLEKEHVHALIMRSLFVMYLEDRGATPKEFYTNVKTEADSFIKLLEDKKSTYRFFKQIEEHFNGNVFPVNDEEDANVTNEHLDLIRRCFIDGDIDTAQGKLFTWRIFKFNIIQVELLSEIYENFLAKFDKKDTGTHYTPPALVELILKEVLPVNKNEKEFNVKVLDPACGSGIFLVEAYKRLVKRWKNAHTGQQPDFKTLVEILRNNIYGIEINANATKVATFSLYLALLDFLNPKDIWYLNGEKFPYLINLATNKNPNTQGHNIYKADTIEENSEIESITFDLIVGNPPFSRKAPDNAKAYCNKHGFAVEFVIPFIHKSAKLCPEGRIALVCTTKLLTNTLGTAQEFRRWLLNDCYVEKVYNLSILRKAPKSFGGQLFTSAVGPASILFFKAKWPNKPNGTIEYWAPKTYIRTHVAEGVIIDNSDVKFLPREECQKKDSKIWKIAQWGTMGDFYLLNRLNDYPSLKKFNKTNKIKYGVGFQLLTEAKTKPKIDSTISQIQYLDASAIKRFYTPKENLTSINTALLKASPKARNFYLKYYSSKNINELKPIDAFRRLTNKEAYWKPNLILKKGLTGGNKICASFVDIERSFRDGVYGFYTDDNEVNNLKYLTSIFCSKFAHYYLFLMGSSYGIEREQIMLEEYLELPIPELGLNLKDEILNLFDETKKNSSQILGNNHSDLENKIDQIIYRSLGLSEIERDYIEDTIRYTNDLFHKGEKSSSLKPISNLSSESITYSKILINELNDFLEIGNLKVSATVYKVSPHTPLCIVVCNFTDDISDANQIKLKEADNSFNQLLSELNRYTISEFAESIYVRKQLRYYSDNQIFIVKPNQKRFWSRSQALEDARSIISEALAMQQ